MNTAFVTGTSSGLGRGLAEQLTGMGWTVYGCSRRGCDLTVVRDCILDLTDGEKLSATLDEFMADVACLDLVVLNAGMLGRIGDLVDTPLDELKKIMDLNLWANKRVMDWLHAWGRPVDQIVMISSGASVLGSRGWGGYALSKAALNMLAKLYAHELRDTHISALAPGIIDTAMMDHLCDEADAEAFPALARLRSARGTPAMPDPQEAARRLVGVLPRLKEWPSGSFIDIREILDPAGYRELFGRPPSNAG